MSMNMQHGSMPEPGLDNSVLEKVEKLHLYFSLLHEILTAGISDCWVGDGYSMHASEEKELYEEAERLAESLRQSHKGMVKKNGR